MKQKSRTLILLSWMHDILLFEGIYVLAIAIWNIRGREVFFFLLNGLFMIFPVALSYLVVSKCKNLWLFLIFSLVTIWGIHTASGNIVTSWLTVFVFLFRFYVKMKPPSLPVKPNLRDSFAIVKQRVLAELDSMKIMNNL